MLCFLLHKAVLLIKIQHCVLSHDMPGL